MSTDPTQQSGSGQPPYYEAGPTGNTQDPYAEQYSQPQDPAQNPYATPPPPDYAYAAYNAQQGYYGAGPQAAPLPLSEAIAELPTQWGKILSKPGAGTFAEEAGKGEWGIILVQLFGYAILTSALGILTSANNLANLRDAMNTGSTSSTAATTAIALSPLLIFFVTLAWTLAIFFIGQGVTFGLAKAFGGQGTFTAQAYASLLYEVPLGVITSLLAFIPILGSLVGLAALVYQLVLSVFRIMGVHRLSGGKSAAVVFIPVAVVLLLACILFIAFAALISAALRGTQ